MTDRVVMKVGQRKQINFSEDMFDNDEQLVEAIKRISTFDEDYQLYYVSKKYCDSEVAYIQTEPKPIFLDQIPTQVDELQTKLDQDIKKNPKYVWDLKYDDNQDYQDNRTLKVAEIDYIEEYGLDKKDTQQKQQKKHYRKKIHKTN